MLSTVVVALVVIAGPALLCWLTGRDQRKLQATKAIRPPIRFILGSLFILIGLLGCRGCLPRKVQKQRSSGSVSACEFISGCYFSGFCLINIMANQTVKIMTGSS